MSFHHRCKPFEVVLVLLSDTTTGKSKALKIWFQNFKLTFGLLCPMLYALCSLPYALCSLLSALCSSLSAFSNFFTFYFVPVCPKPPAPLSVCFNSSTSIHSACSTLLMIICAILSPSTTTKSLLERLTRIIFISPR